MSFYTEKTCMERANRYIQIMPVIQIKPVIQIELVIQIKLVWEKERKTMHYILLSAGIFLMETLIKKKREETKDTKVYAGGNVRITTYHNYGAFLNSGEKRPLIVKAVSVLLTVFLSALFLLTFTKYGNKQLRLGLAFLLGGAYSNTYDRIRRGYVVDYLMFPKVPGKIKTIVFNISDFCIAVGACLIVIKQK